MDDRLIMQSPRSKVERAREHIKELSFKTQPLSADLFEITMDRESIHSRVRDPGVYIHYRPRASISELMALIIGDAVHNLHAALDHLCTSICRQVDPGAKPYFPTSPNREDAFKRSAWTLLEAALPGVKDMFFTDVRPENGVKDTLWSFTDLDNDDKHNLLVPTATVVNISGINVKSSKGISMSGNTFAADANMPFAIAGFAHHRPVDVKIWGKPRIDVDLKFGSDTAFADREVISTLQDVAGLVTGTLDAFENMLRQRG